MTIHWHNDVEFVYIKKGSAFYKLNGCTFKLNEGEGVFVNSKQLHVITMGEDDCLLDCVIFHPMLLCTSKHIAEKYVYPMISNSAAPYIILHENVPWEREVLFALSHIFELSEKDDCELKMMKAVFEIWKLIFENIKLNISLDKKYDSGFEIIKKIMLYIQSNYMEEITLDSLCNAGGLGRTSCTKLFQKYVNTTPIEYVRRYRIAKSIELLKSTDKTVTEIAYETGFSGTSFFTKTFKEMLGITPSQMKKGGYLNA